MTKWVILVTVLVQFLSVKNQDQKWNYHNFENWPDSCLHGKKQAPIDITTGSVISKSIPPVEFHNYDKLFKAFVENNGHTVQIKFASPKEENEEENKEENKEGEKVDENNNEEGDNCDTPFITGAVLESEYILDNVHFHWDSEHTIDGNKYPLEAHFVHYEKSFSSVQDALDVKNGIVVLAVFYDICKCSPGVFEDISSTVEEVSDDVGCVVEVPNQITVKSLLPKSTQSFYTYEGSLTTPNCNEFVTWIVFARPAKIDKRQYHKLINIMGDDNKPLLKNCRPVQELNGRDVYYTSTFTENIYGYVRSFTKLFSGSPRG